MRERDGSTHNTAGRRTVPPAAIMTDQRSVPNGPAGGGWQAILRSATRSLAHLDFTQLAWIGEHERRSQDPACCSEDFVRYRLTSWKRTTSKPRSLAHMAGRAGPGALLAGRAAGRGLPPWVAPTVVVGAVTEAAAAESGLRAGTPVVAGCSDSAVEDYAAGAIRPGQMIVKLATAGNVNVMTAAAHPHPRTLTYSHVIPGLWYTVVATNTAASAERWFRDGFCQSEVERAAAGGVSVYDLLHESAKQIPAGAEGLFFHPYLLGERAPYWDPNLRGSFVGATMRHGKAHFVRALLEGVAYSLRDCFRTIVDLQLPVDEVRDRRRGKGDLWAQIVDIFGRPMVSRPAATPRRPPGRRRRGPFGDTADAVGDASGCARRRARRREPRRYDDGSPYCAIHDAAGIYTDLSTQ